jgi:hypothetical protein
MLGDYIAVAYAPRRPVAVFSIAAEPRRNEFRQGIAAAVIR